MIKAVSQANRIMRPLKDYIELGIKNKEVLKVVEILNQLDDEELTFIMAKYVKFAERDPTPRQIKLPKPKQVYEHLGMCVADYRSFQWTLSNKIYELYYEDFFEQYRRENEEWKRQQADYNAENKRWIEAYKRIYKTQKKKEVIV